MQNMSESSDNFLLEFVLPLLQAKKAERLENRRTNASQVRLGFNIPLEHHQQHRAVMMAHVKDKLRFFCPDFHLMVLVKLNLQGNTK